MRERRKDGRDLVVGGRRRRRRGRGVVDVAGVMGMGRRVRIRGVGWRKTWGVKSSS